MSVAAHKRTSGTQAAEVNGMWRVRCTALEDRVQDLTRALEASEQQRRELAADYRHVLDRLWKINAGLTTRRER